MCRSIKQLRGGSTPSKSRLWYNQFILTTELGKTLDVGKSTFWEYGFDTIDTNSDLNPTIVGDILDSGLADNSYDTVLCNGMYECVKDPQKMIDECFRIARDFVLFGFVGKEYKPYKLRNGLEWKYFDFKETIPGHEIISFDKKYHFFLCKRPSSRLSYRAIEILI